MIKAIFSFIIFLSIFNNASFANIDTTVYFIDSVDIQPNYLGGEDALKKEIFHKTTYPIEARENDEEGTVIIRAIITKGGNLINPKVVSSSKSKILDEVAIATIKNIEQNWIPAKKNNNNVNCYKDIPIVYKLVQADFKNQKLSFDAYYAGMKLYRAKKYQEAIVKFDEVLSYNKDLESLYNKAICLFKLNDLESGCKILLKIKHFNLDFEREYKLLNCNQFNAQTGTLHYNKGVALFQNKRYNAAIMQFDSAIYYNENDTDAIYNKATCFYNSNKKQKACLVLNRLKNQGVVSAVNTFSNINCDSILQSYIDSKDYLPFCIIDLDVDTIFINELESNIHKFVEQKLIYPKYALENDITGLCVVRVIYSENGELKDVFIKKSSKSYYLDKEAIRVLKMLPNYRIGKIVNRNVSYYVDLPIHYKSVNVRY